jgi:hypothetical protein
MPAVDDLERLRRASGEAPALALVSVVGAAQLPVVSSRASRALAGLPVLAIPSNGCDTHRSFALPDTVRVEALRRLDRALFQQGAA